jgi:hypothetical protein
MNFPIRGVTGIIPNPATLDNAGRRTYNQSHFISFFMERKTGGGAGRRARLIDFLLNRLAPGWRAPGNAAARARVGVAAGGMGIALNLLLFAAKLAVGLLSGSVAILSDAFNNISDTGSSLVALIACAWPPAGPTASTPSATAVPSTSAR